MVILRGQNKITDFFMILSWASPFNTYSAGIDFSRQNPRIVKICIMAVDP